YAQAYSFKYSARPGTPAAALPGPVPDEAKDERLAALQELLATQQRQFNENVVGRTFDVLLERPGRREGQLLGRSPYNQAVHVTARQDLLGTLASVHIERCKKHSLEGSLAPSPTASDITSPKAASAEMVP
ncbi:MAG: TRAM domain-containing protein, partial [Alphaproteobacteria bacterium]